ncbi:hypothetical protein TMEC54S_00194 [Thauera mechernichensis]|uniref:hypothetical protein n=1 Tax=Thauera sp. 27 TaxID=305700 RepID=UPI0002D13B65|nr:hypothetical protein [Thauera sp. 27]ENO79002.1 hypothetical protein B447_13534 [Thauera sp. 27]
MSAVLFEAHLRAHLEALPEIEGFVIGGWLHSLSHGELEELIDRLEVMLSDEDAELENDLVLDLLLATNLGHAAECGGHTLSGLDEIEEAMVGLEHAAHLVAVERAGLIEVEGLVSMSDEERPSLSLTQRGVERLVVRRWMSDADIGGSGTERVLN